MNPPFSCLKNNQIAVVYLARKAEGLEAFKAFTRSYIQHPAGIDHDLMIIFKGYEEGEELQQARSIFSSVTYTSLLLADEGFDLGSYLTAAESLPHEYVCFFNTFSQILSDHWLQKMYAHISLPHVGLVGATGSYEGLYTSITFLHKAKWLYSHLRLNKALYSSLKKYLTPHVTKRKERPEASTFVKTRNRIVYHCQGMLRFLSRVSGVKTLEDLESTYTLWWKQKMAHTDLALYSQCPCFPNPHIRSNAFMIKRETFLALKRTSFKNKMDTFQFESGYESMTRQLRSIGLKALIIGKNGQGYDLDQWSTSETFRLNQQTNLLVSDKQTEAFAGFNPFVQQTYMLMTWGDLSPFLPSDLSNLGIHFKADLDLLKK